MKHYENKICLEEKSVIRSIVKELIEKNLTEDFKKSDLAANKDFLASFENEISSSVVRAFKSKGYNEYDEINTAEVIEFTDNLIFGRLRYKNRMAVAENSKKLAKLKSDDFHKGNKETLAETRLGYAIPGAQSIKSLGQSFIKVN